MATAATIRKQTGDYCHQERKAIFYMTDMTGFRLYMSDVTDMTGLASGTFRTDKEFL